MTQDFIEKARLSWGANMPDWVASLAQACAATSQNRVAKKLGVSASLISTVLSNRYEGDMARVELLCRGEFERSTVPCPTLGEIAPAVCDRWQAKSRTLGTANNQNARMFRACRACELARRNRA